MVLKMTSVKQKVEGIAKKTSEVNAAVRKLQSNIREQVRVNNAALEQKQSNIRKLEGDIKETTRVVQAAVNKLHSNIRSQAAENSSFIRAFYFG